MSRDLWRRIALAAFVCMLIVSSGCGEDEADVETRGSARVVGDRMSDSAFSTGRAGTSALFDTTLFQIEELFYDDGGFEQRNSPWSERAGGQVAVAFTPGSYPAKIKGVSFFVGDNGIPTKAFRVRIYPGDRSTGPVERDLLDAEIMAAASFAEQWVEIHLVDQDIVINEGDFFVPSWHVPRVNPI